MINTDTYEIDVILHLQPQNCERECHVEVDM